MNVNPSILIIGKSFLGLEKYLNKHNYTYKILLDERLLTDKNSGDPRIIACNFKDKKSVEKTLKTIPKPDALLCIYENYIVQASWVSKYYNLPGLSEEAAKSCTDKELMRKKFATAKEQISPGHQVVNSLNDLKNFATKYKFPLILKPANLTKSMLVHKCHNLDELLDAYNSTINIIDDVYAKYAPGNIPKLIVEEFMEGSIHSVDAFVDAKGKAHVLDQIVDYQTGYDIGYDDNFHYSRIMPSKLSEADQKALRKVAKIGCETLGMTSSPAHIEIIITTEGPRIVEIGARNGGYRERMHYMANDISTTDNALRLALNQPLDIKAKKHDPIAVLELFPKISGDFAGLANEEVLRKLPSLNYLSIKAKLGQYVGTSSKGHKMVAIIILHNASQEQFQADLEYVNKSVFVKIQ